MSSHGRPAPTSSAPLLSTATGHLSASLRTLAGYCFYDAENVIATSVPATRYLIAVSHIPFLPPPTPPFSAPRSGPQHPYR
ncbi:hypothetical protein JKG47_17760 [Acidithiobacillus sp. MC6.1]|nr:hypothetical protein [Acidithiobacillus sp. MC6.1]